MKIQKFSYHCHTNGLGVFDGSNSAIEMIKQAEKIGYSEIGISNHICYHKNITEKSPMFFSNYNTAVDIYKKNIEEIRKAANESKIKVRVGFEVDFFSSKEWRKDFEKMMKELDADYYIGATHFLRDKKEDKVFGMYFAGRNLEKFDEEGLDYYIESYWNNIIETIKSGYFSFIAHIDVIKIFSWYKDDKWDEYKWKIIETLAEYKHPYELNTSGITKSGEQNPASWMLEELNKRNVPIIINDDAHSIAQVGAHYETAEKILADIGYKNRWKPF